MEKDDNKCKLISYDEENDVITIDCGHSILILNGSPSSEACKRFVKILSEMKARQRYERSKMKMK